MESFPEAPANDNRAFLERAQLAERQMEAADDAQAKAAWQTIVDGWRELARLHTR